MTNNTKTNSSPFKKNIINNKYNDLKMKKIYFLNFYII